MVERNSPVLLAVSDTLPLRRQLEAGKEVGKGRGAATAPAGRPPLLGSF